MNQTAAMNPTTHASEDDARRVLERLRAAPLLMPYLHYSVPLHTLWRLFAGDRERTQKSLAVLVQRGEVEYLENCSPDHYHAFARRKEDLS